jgi:hypothetical protein
VVRLEVTWAECSTYSASWDFWRPAIAGWQLGRLTGNGDAGSVANNFAGHDDECMCIAAATTTLAAQNTDAQYLGIGGSSHHTPPASQQCYSK